MTYVLVCALCATTPASFAPSQPSEHLPRLSVERGGTPDLGTVDVDMLRPALLLNEAAHSDGGSDHGGSHMGPMWIMMGVMMVAMMATFGFFMMRNETASTQPAIQALPVGGGSTTLGGLRFGPGPG
jgi:hypothetical protein